MNKLRDRAWLRWIVQDHESLVRPVKWCGWGVGGVWRSFIIHEMGGQSVSGSDGLKLYYWSVSTPLGLLTWYLKDWGFNWRTAQTRIISGRKVIGIIDALGRPPRWGGERHDLTLHDRGRYWWLFVLIIQTWLMVLYIFTAIMWWKGYEET